MIVERITFENPDMAYRSRYAARHAVRYAVVRSIVAGKRILDIGCGEGYGAQLLRDWGAREVVGVDLSPAAVAAARRAFGGEGMAFLPGNAEELEKTLDGAEPFDLVLSFDTLEYLARPEHFLAALPRLLAGGGAIVLSCSNGHAPCGGNDDPLRLSTYSFEAFRTLAEQHLGEASMWMLGAPLLGEMNFLPNGRLVQDGHEARNPMAQVGIVENTVFVPVQPDLAAGEQTCSHYIGLWGATVTSNAAISSQSVPACHEPSAVRDRLKRRVSELEEAVETRYEPALARLSASEPELRRQQEEIGRLTAERDALLSENAALQKRIGAVLEPEVAALAGKARALGQEVERLTRAKSDLEAEKALREAQVGELSAEVETLRETLSQTADTQEALEDRLRAAEAARLEYEPELARLRAHVEHATFEKEVQLLRSRLMVHAERSRRAAESVAAMRQKLRETEDMQRSWFMPEIDRLNRIIADYETTKREWWDPQLELRAARIVELETDCREWFEPELARRDARIAELESQVRLPEAVKGGSAA